MEGIFNTWQTLAVDPLSGVLSSIQSVVGNYAIAIILFTIGIRLLMVPLTLKQIRSQRKMQLIQPDLEAMRRKFKGDRQATSEATMKLYRERGVNPVSGCLPALVQLPILLALYGGILTLSSRGLLNEQFLWFNLARADSTIQIVGQDAPTEPVDLVLATTDLPSPLEASLAVSFTQSAPNFRFRTDVVDAGTALEALNNGAVAAIVVDEKVEASKLPNGVQEDRLIQAVGLLVERDRSVTRLTETEVASILRGEITNWAQVSGASGPIVLHGLRDDFGSRSLMQRLLLNEGETIAVPIREHESRDAYLSAIRDDPNALGLSMPIRTDDVRMVNIEARGATRAFPPIGDALRDGQYALAREIYVYWGSADGAAETYVRDWWLSGQGQEAAQAAGFTRLPPRYDFFGSGGFYISVLALLAGGFQLIQARMMQSASATGQAATMNRVMQFMPLIVVVFAWTFQAGLVLYWVISSIIAIIQQYFTTGTGKLIPAHWSLARDVMGEQSAKAAQAVSADQQKISSADEESRPRRPRRRRRRRRGG
jgi:YidC/Oxa1 family membrane protein insertase